MHAPHSIPADPDRNSGRGELHNTILAARRKNHGIGNRRNIRRNILNLRIAHMNRLDGAGLGIGTNILNKRRSLQDLARNRDEIRRQHLPHSVKVARNQEIPEPLLVRDDFLGGRRASLHRRCCLRSCRSTRPSPHRGASKAHHQQNHLAHGGSVAQTLPVNQTVGRVLTQRRFPFGASTQEESGHEEHSEYQKGTEQKPIPELVRKHGRPLLISSYADCNPVP